VPGTDAAPTGPGASGAGDRYLLGDSTAEVEHLAHQAEVYADEAAELLDRVGVADGSSAIDIGCGVLGILALLCARVGSSGRVVGLERESRLLDAARQGTAQQGLPIEFGQGGANRLDLPSDSFDFVHERAVLLNVQSPRPSSPRWSGSPGPAAWWPWKSRIPLAGCATRRIRPGTRCLPSCSPPTGATERPSIWGRRIARALRDAGLADVQVRVTARVTHAAEYYQTFLLTLTSLVRDQIITGGRLTAADFDAQSASLRAHLEQPGTLTCQPTLWQAWGTQPKTG
jgi:SAM-dependent methyltransferase